MSPLDAGFRKRLAMVFHARREGVADALREGQTRGSVRRDVESDNAAGLLIAMVEGYGSLAQNAQDPKVMKAGIRNIVDWLRSLRPLGNRRRADDTVVRVVSNGCIPTGLHVQIRVECRHV